MRESEILVNRFPGFPALFSRHPLPAASKCAKIKDNRMPAPLNVRKFRLFDLEPILEIEHASFGRDAYDRNLFAEFFHKCGDLFLVAEGRRGVCGYSVTCIRGVRAELVSIAVDPKTRGKGAASALLDSTLRRLRRRGVLRFHLTVRLTNHPARAFYEKYGFRRMRVLRGYYGDGEDGLAMTKEL
jgi:ribosomal-protein-alanine N-acetyltransferase